MTDTDLIACVYPYDTQDALRAIKLNKNLPRYVPGIEQQEHPRDRRGRGSTEEPEPRRGDNNADPRARLELRFSHGPKTSAGFIFGCDEDCDILLPNFRGVSSYHFALTFDDYNRPIVRDIGSFIGTQVTYNNDGEGTRRNFTWIVGGHRVPRRRTPIVVKVNEHLKFQLVLALHDMHSQLYNDSIERFRRGTTGYDDLFNRLKMLPETERPTGTHTPGSGPIFLKKRLGEGSFGVVTHFWNVSTADEYALKQPSNAAIRKNQVDLDDWKKEAEIMGRISHEHIVRLLWQAEKPWPQLGLEYVPGGSLVDQKGLSRGECRQVLYQLLSALTYLHGLKPPILHRDIKPANILVQYRYADEIYVKFGDFGVSGEERESGQWKTACGTRMYRAPEMADLDRDRHRSGRRRTRYTPVVDVWSLGLVIFELLSGIPQYKTEYRMNESLWPQKILGKLVEDLRRRPNDLLQFLSTRMLILDPALRHTAQMCYDEAFHLFHDPDAARETSIPAAGVQDRQTTVPYENAPTVIYQGVGIPRHADDTIGSAEIENYIIRSSSLSDSVSLDGSVSTEDIVRQAARSNNPPPSSRRQRPSRVSKPSAATRSRRLGHASVVEAVSRGNKDEPDPDTGFFTQHPANSFCLGSSISVLGQEVPSSWGESVAQSLTPRPPSREPSPVVAGTGYEQAEYGVSISPVQSVEQPWSGVAIAGGAYWDAEARYGGYSAVQGIDGEDEASAAALLMALQSGSHAV